MPFSKDRCDEKIEQVRIELKDELKKEITTLRKELLSAFPDEDLRDHLDDHEEIQDKKEDKKHLFRTLRNSLLNTVLLAFLATIGMALKDYFNLGG